MHLDAAFGARVHLRVALGVLSALLFVWTAKAQDVEHAEVATARAAHASRLAANPRGLSLAIRTHLARLRFAQGELLTLALEFRDDSGARHLFDAIAYDRSGRLGIDRVIVAPASDVEDPLRDYYRAMGFGFIGGGLSMPPAPLDGPRTLSLDVNEQVRFLRPGVYVVYVESHRFLDGSVHLLTRLGEHAGTVAMSVGLGFGWSKQRGGRGRRPPPPPPTSRPSNGSGSEAASRLFLAIQLAGGATPLRALTLLGVAASTRVLVCSLKCTLGGAISCWP